MYILISKNNFDVTKKIWIFIIWGGFKSLWSDKRLFN